MVKKTDSNIARKRRQKRVRGKIHGTSERPRLNVYRSAKNIYAQIIDDKAGVTLVAVNSLQSEFSDNFGGNTEAAKNIGIKIAKLAIEKGINVVVFDRAGYLYHGRVKAVADGAREGGLSF